MYIIRLKSVLKIKFRKVRSNRTRVTREILYHRSLSSKSSLPFGAYAIRSVSVLFRLLVQLSLFSLSSSLPFSHSFSSPLFHRINRILSLTHSISFIPSLSLSLSFCLSFSLSHAFECTYIYIYIYSFMQAKTQSPSLAFFFSFSSELRYLDKNITAV